MFFWLGSWGGRYTLRDLFSGRPYGDAFSGKAFFFFLRRSVKDAILGVVMAQGSQKSGAKSGESVFFYFYEIRN